MQGNELGEQSVICGSRKTEKIIDTKNYFCDKKRCDELLGNTAT